MKRTALFLTLAIAASLFAWAKDYTYAVDWHWGLIDVHAGKVNINVDYNEDNIVGAVSGNSVPIRGEVFSISDTISAQLSLTEAEIDYINGVYSHHQADEYSGQYRSIDGQGTLDASAETMEAVSITAMLPSFFYYAEHLDFASMNEGESVSVPVIGNGQQSRLLITYQGTEQSEYGEAYVLSIIFDGDGAEQYPINCLVSTDDRAPLLFSAELRIGHVQLALL